MGELAMKAAAPRIVTKETLDNGKPRQILCVDIGGQSFAVYRGLLSYIKLENEWYEDVAEPAAVIDSVEQALGFRPDLFTFWQRLPEVTPRYSYHTEWESISAMPLKSYEHWWKCQVGSSVRGHVRKAIKSGVEVVETEFTDEFVRGMVEIFNETPIRQNRRFWHYGKSFDTVKREFSRNLFRESVLAAYCQGRLIGFVMVADAGRYAEISQIISKLEHRDKAPNNALLAKAVEVCSERGFPYLAYANWTDGPLADFKRQNGFEKVDLPRYFVPLTRKGAVALRCGVHRGWKGMLPERTKDRLKIIRNAWYQQHVKWGGASAKEASSDGRQGNQD